ncbi:unnamed protein product [Ambrosiozyma monospora]|uniref:Unnamed protein product n=1 Tax=Ambrosiozyma monospora TaxID=43982 RepID=A0ACB5UCX8_AMBMO|nr:unnamed protein product [Ambrosiozyma monospora]
MSDDRVRSRTEEVPSSKSSSRPVARAGSSPTKHDGYSSSRNISDASRASRHHHHHRSDSDRERRDRSDKDRSERRHRSGRHKSSRKRDPVMDKPKNLDTIDKLDVTGFFSGGGFHHDGPFDACTPHRNKNSRAAPVMAFPADGPNNSIKGVAPVNNKEQQFDMVFGISEEDPLYTTKSR